MQQSNLFKSKTFSKRINRFNNSTFIEETYKSFDFNNNLKSDNLEDLEFTNFVSSNICKKYLILTNICQQISKNEKEFDIKEIQNKI